MEVVDLAMHVKYRFEIPLDTSHYFHLPMLFKRKKKVTPKFQLTLIQEFFVFPLILGEFSKQPGFVNFQFIRIFSRFGQDGNFRSFFVVFYGGNLSSEKAESSFQILPQVFLAFFHRLRCRAFK